MTFYESERNKIIEMMVKGKTPKEISVALGGLGYLEKVNDYIAKVTPQERWDAMARIKLKGRKYK